MSDPLDALRMRAAFTANLINEANNVTDMDRGRWLVGALAVLLDSELQRMLAAIEHLAPKEPPQ